MTLTGYISGRTCEGCAIELQARSVTRADIIIYHTRSDHSGFGYEYGVKIIEKERLIGPPTFFDTRIVNAFCAGLGTPKIMDMWNASCRAHSICDDLTSKGIEARVIEFKPTPKVQLNLEWSGSPRAEIRPRL